MSHRPLQLLALLFLTAVTAWGQPIRTDLEPAQWICAPTNGGMPLFRKTVGIAKPVRRATISASALGVYTLSVNGHEVGGPVLKPGWTDYRKEIFFQTIPLSRMDGDSLCVEARVSNGWWIGGITRGVYGQDNRHAFICRIDIEYKDGTTDAVVTDTTWLCATDGPLISGDIYNGETYDARRVPSAWHHALPHTQSKGRLIPQEGPNVVIRDKKLWRQPKGLTIYEGADPTGTTYGKIHVVSQPTKTGKGIRLRKGQTLLVDFGQNMVGWIDFTAKGKAGTTLTWTFGEMLNSEGDADRLDKGPAGSLWTHNLRSAKATLTYTMRGQAKGERYHPSHTFFGFRYAELRATSDVELHRVVGQVVGSDIREWGTFECSNADVNQLYSNVWWGQRGNFLSIPTDCPQRDERLGWTGDTQIFSTTALYNSDVKDFYRKWMRDMRNGQREDGAYPCTAPAANMWGYGGSAWGDAGIIVPWNVYVMTGDRLIIQENWESMSRWMAHCASQHEDGWTHIGAETDFGDWLAYKEVEKRYVSYAYYAHTSELMAQMAALMGKNDEAERYRKLNSDIKEEFHRRYVSDGEINTGRDTQTAYLLALHFNLLDEGERAKAQNTLRQNIEANGCKLSTGFVGTGILMETLTECGMTDLAYRLLLQRENPSWLYSIDQGATTVWERWDSYTKATGFHKHPWNMNSFNHYSYGAVAGWFYSTILGIRPDERQPGFTHTILAPHPGGGMTYVRGGTQTPHGRIEAEWRKATDGTYTYHVRLPRGIRATLHLGNGETREIEGNGHRQTFRLNIKE